MQNLERLKKSAESPFLCEHAMNLKASSAVDKKKKR
jgi:hypothetical protein